MNKNNLDWAISQVHHWCDDPFPLEGECKLVQITDGFVNDGIVFAVKTKNKHRRMLSSCQISACTLDDVKSPLAYCDGLLSTELFAHRAYWYSGLWC